MPVRDQDGNAPRLAADAFVAPNAEVIGDVSMAEQSSVWFSSVVRSNGAPVSLGVGTDIQDNSLVESAPDQPARLGNYVSLGHGATVRAADLDDHVLIAMHAVVLPGCRIGTGTIVAANATVPAGTIVPPNSLVVGDQGRIVRETTEAERGRIRDTSSHYMELARHYREGLGRGH
jgi:carbonic anhydrase/acetyltransferase-like protein (isoleucine patch superfamily)